MPITIQDFIARWSRSAGNERANKDSFLIQLCEVLDLPIPDPKGKDAAYCYEKDIQRFHLDGSISKGAVDLYRSGSFVLEAKQGSNKENHGSTPVRGTRAYDVFMERAFRQVVGYSKDLTERIPFLITCDIGYSFHVWECFSGITGGYGARKNFSLVDLKKPEVQDYFRAIWLDPESLDPAKRRARVTRDVAQQLGKLAASLEGKFPPQAIANFLMRCVFTFFAEDRGVTITHMYNLLLKLRSGEAFTPKEREQHAAAQTEILRHLHDELDQTVLEAYGWPANIADAKILERLVALNRDRAEEERSGMVRWLRPEYQAPESVRPMAKPMLEAEPETEAVVFEPMAPALANEPQPWPKELKDQLAALRALLLASDRLWTLEEVAAAFRSRGRYRESIVTHLELLVDLGVLAKLESLAGNQFHRPQSVSA